MLIIYTIVQSKMFDFKYSSDKQKIFQQTINQRFFFSSKIMQPYSCEISNPPKKKLMKMYFRLIIMIRARIFLWVDIFSSIAF